MKFAIHIKSFIDLCYLKNKDLWNQHILAKQNRM